LNPERPSHAIATVLHSNLYDQANVLEKAESFPCDLNVQQAPSAMGRDECTWWGRRLPAVIGLQEQSD
jgi:hypothetical protein